TTGGSAREVGGSSAVAGGGARVGGGERPDAMGPSAAASPVNDTEDTLIAEAEAAPDLTAARVEAIPPEFVAETAGEYLRASLARVRGGDAGVLPVVVALALVTVVFSFLNSTFLTAGNVVNLFDQSAVFIVLAMAEGFVLLLGEIALSIGYVAAIGGVITAALVQPSFNWPWWLAIVAGVLACAVIGAVQGTII